MAQCLHGCGYGGDNVESIVASVLPAYSVEINGLPMPSEG